MKSRLSTLILILVLGIIVTPVFAETFPGEGSSCTSDPANGSGLRECGTPDDNECNPGGTLYREANQDGCPTEWHWKAGWFLARYNDGKISRANFPREFESVLPPVIVTTVCKQALAIDTNYYGCFDANQTGYDVYSGAFYDYIVFVNDPAECPATYNGLPFDDYDDTQSYVLDYYLFTPAELAILGGGLRPVSCYYT